jgi:hypothetical protein
VTTDGGSFSRSGLERWLARLLPRPVPHWGTTEFADPDLPASGLLTAPFVLAEL